MTVRITIRDTRSGAGAAFLLGCAAILAAVCAGGCESPTDPEPPPTGGQQFLLDYDTFVAEIDPILTARGCDNLSCHGGGIRGTFELSPFDDKDPATDYAQAVLQVFGDDPASSPLLMKPLDESAGGDIHTADSQQYGFMTTSDPDYQAILAWIEAGEYR